MTVGDAATLPSPFNPPEALPGPPAETTNEATPWACFRPGRFALGGLSAGRWANLSPFPQKRFARTTRNGGLA